MNEEKIIKYIKDEIEIDIDTCHWFDDIPNNKTRMQLEKSINAHQGLLYLYQKEKEENVKLSNIIKSLNEEKERNKELLNEKESVFDKGYLEGTRDGEEEIRDEIRGIIKDYYERKSIPDLVISRIEELLEEQENENSIK